MSILEELIARSQAGDSEATETLVKENSGLIWAVARRFTGRGAELEDLYQLGCLGFLKAVEGFDLAYGTQFSTYAVPMIAGEIKRFLRDDGIVKVSRTLKENCWKIHRENEQFRQKYGREPSMDELSDLTELSGEEIALALESSAEVESLYKTIPQKDGSEVCLLDRMESQGSDMQQLLNRVVLEQLLTELPDTERKLIIMRYLQDKTQSEVAVVLGVSQVQVSRLEKKILKQMREKLVS